MVSIKHDQLNKLNKQTLTNQEDIMTTHKMTIETNNIANEAANMVVETAKSTYVLAVLAVLGVFAFVTAVLIAWPAVSYLASKLF